MADSYWYCEKCDTTQTLSDAWVKDHKFSCAHVVGILGEACGGGLERVTSELADKLLAKKKAKELSWAGPKPEAPAQHTPLGFCPACGWSTEARLAAVLAKDKAELRDKFAMAALTGMIARDDSHKLGSMHESIAELAYRLADAMLAERGLLPRDLPGGERVRAVTEEAKRNGGTDG